MNKEFQMLRKKQRFGLRKLNIGLVSVLLGFTIFGYNLASQAPVAHAATSAVATSGASGSGTGGANESQASNSQAASTTSSVATASQATSSTQVTVPAASQSSAPANSGNATSSPANHTASNTDTTPSSQTVSVNETTSSATQARTLMMKFPAAQSRILMTNLAVRNLNTADDLPKSAQNSETDTTLPPTTQTYTPVEQPLLYDYGLHVSATGTRDGNTWVNKTVAKGIFGQDYPGHTLDTIFGSKTGIITSHPDKYFFAAYVDFSESYHRVILLARSQDPSDKNLYSYTIHTYTQNNSTTTTKPGDSTKEQYTGTGRSTHDLIFQNYDGDSFSVKLNGFEGGYGKYGLLPVFDGGLLDPTYGSNTIDQNDTAAKTKSIGFWASMIPQKTSTKVRYVDQATGKDIVQPMEISGFGYQGFKVKGDAPTVKGYNLVSKPEFLPSTNKASAYEDGTISPYKVGQTYDLALSDSVVIKQTVIHTDGTVRATPYYKGSPLTNASKVLGRESYNDHMSFGTPDGKFYTYTNRIGQVDDSYIYYYAKDSDPKGSEMRLHFIDVTGVNNSYYAPSDGPELDADKQTIHGNIGENYSFTYAVPKGYDQVGTSDVTGTYSKTHHDAYVYVKANTPKPVTTPVKTNENTTLTDDQAKAGIANNSELPDDTTYTWSKQPDTTQPGDKTGEVTVKYPGGTSASVTVPVHVNSEAETNQPEVSTQTVDQNAPVDPTSVVTNQDKLPKGTTYSWTKEPNTETAGQPATGSLHVAYPDGSSEDVPVTVNVKSNKDQYQPELITPAVDQNAPVDPTSVVTNQDKLPKGTTYSWTKEPNTETAGQPATGSLHVAYPDGSSEDVPVTVNVKSNKDQYQPELITPAVDQNAPVDPTSVVTNQDKLPKGTTYSWTKEPNTETAGQPATGSLHVAYPDGSSEDVPVTVNVKSNKDQYQPELITPAVDQNAPVDPTSVVTNQDKLPKGTTYSWTKEPNTETAGQPATGSLHVAYPDGSSEDVPVTVNVKSNKDQYQPELITPAVDQNAPVDPTSVVTNQDKLPKGTTYSWTKEPNTETAGQPATGSLHVAYPDGSSEDVPVTVNVKSNKDQYQPELITPAVDQNAPVDPTSVVTNQDKLPKGTTYSWTKEPNTETAGQPATGSLHVAYPDGSSEDVPVTVNVKSNKDQYQPELITPAVDQNAPVDPTSVVTNQDKLPKGTTYSWTKEPNTETAGQPATGSLHVAYPDGSSEDVPVTVNVKSNKDQYQPELITPAVDQNAPVDPTSVVTNQDKLPKGTTYSWTKEPNTETAGQPATGSLHVAYPDGSSEDVPVTVNVKSNKDQYQPELITPAVDQNAPVDPTSVVTNQDKLPKGTTYSWTKEPNTETAGQPATGSLHVAYPDGSSEDVPVTVNVKSNKDQYQPELITPAVDQNAPVDPTSVVTNQDKLPKGTTYSWTKEPNTETAGQPATGSLHVAYPDGSSEDVPVTVNVKSNKDQYQPELITPAVDQNAPVDPTSVVTNQDKLPKGTTYSWTKEPNTETAGQPATGSLHVAYPDGSSEDVPVTVNVKSNKDQYQPELITPAVDQNAPVDPTSVVTNQDKLPKGTTYSWTKEPNTETAGQPATGSLHVAYPDGSSEDVPVTVNVKSNKDQYQPELITPAVDQNAPVDPTSVVTNQDKLPKGTTYSWTKEPNTETAGQPATGSLHVAYPDGSSEDVPVTVNVKSNKDQYQPELITPAVDQNAPVDPTSVVTNQDKLPKGTTYSWTKEPNTETAGQPATGSLHVAYPDGSSEDVPVTVNVKSNKDQYQPELITPAVDQNAPVDPTSVVTNQDKLPKGTTYSWTKEPNTETAGQPATGSLHVAYPDGSSEDVPVTVNVKSNKDQYQPELITPAVDQNAPVDPTSVVTNQDKLPKGTTYSWTKEPNTETAGQPATGSLHVAYPDGSSEDVPVTVNVKSNKDQYQPELITPAVDQNAPVDPTSVVTNQDKLPKGTTYSWTKEPNTETAGQPATGSLHVAYPDGSSEDVPVTVNVKSNKDQYQPELITPAVDQNAPVDPTSVVTNQDKLPKGTTYSWTKEPNTETAGQPATGSLHVAYPDGSSEDVPVTVNVKSNKDQYQPELITPAVDQNAPVDPTSVVTNQDKLPKGTTYSWTKEPNTETAGQPATGSLHVAYPDGSSEDVPVTVNVKSNKDQYQPELITPAVDQNAPVDPTSVVTNQDKLPKGTTYSWTKEPNTETAGQPATGSLHVAYPDGSSEDVPVTVNVKSNKDQYQPELITPAVDQNAPVDPTSVVTNQDKLPKGTTYSWTKEPNTETAGQPATGSLHVAYPDGSSEDVPVTVNVKSNKDQYQPELITPAVDQNAPVDPTSVVTNQDKLPKGTTYSWTKEPNTETAGQPATGSLHVAYPDGSSEDVPVTVNVKSNKDQYQPELITPAVDQNAPVDPTSVVTNQDKLPKGTTYSWTKEPNTETAGQPATGSLHVAYPDGSSEDVPVTVNVKSNKDQYQPELITPAVDQNAPVDPTSVVTNQDKLPKGTTYSWTKEPNTETAGQPATGSLHVAYPDGSSEDVPVTVNVKSNKDQYQPELITPAVDQNAPVDPTSVVTNQDKLPKGTTYSWTKEPNTETAGQPATGSLHVAYPDGSSEDVPVTVNVKSNKDQYQPELITPAVDQNAPVDPTSVVTNQDKLPKGTTYSWTKEPNTETAGQPATGSLHVAYPDGSSEDVPVTVNVKSNADQYTPEVSTPTVDQNAAVDPTSVVTNQAKLPQGTTYSWTTTPDTSKAGQTANGSLHVAYPDGSSEDVTVKVNVKSNADQYTPEVSTPTVDQNAAVDPNSVVTNQAKLPQGTKYSWTTTPDTSKAGQTANGSLHVAYPDGSSEDVTVKVNVKSNADQYTPTAGKITVDNGTKLEQGTPLTEDQLATAIPNHADLPNRTTYTWKDTVTVGNDTSSATVVVTYPDQTSEEVRVPVEVKGTYSETYQPKLPTDKVKVDDKNNLTEDEKTTVKTAVEDANKDKSGKSTLPEGTDITVGDNGDVTVTYPDGSKDTIPGDKVVEGKGTEGQTDADKNEPKVPGDKVKVDDPTKLTKDEKSDVEQAIKDANKDESGKSTLPEGSKVTVGDNGDVTVTYPDGSKDTIPGDKVVEGKGTEGQTDADKNEPKVPGDKVKVDDPTKLTKDEKSDVEQAIKDANKDESGKSTLPEGSKVTVGDNGDVTVTYPDGSKDTIPGDKVVEGKGTEGQTDADKNEPKVPGDKVKVDDPTKLTKDEKSDVEQAIKDANKDESGKSTLPEGSKVTVGDNGDVTVTYPDGSKDTIPGDKVVEGKGTEGQTDADKNEPKVPGDKVKVDDPTKLTKDEKSDVEQAIKDANKDESGKSTLPEGSKVTVGDNGDVTVTYPDGSKDTIPGDKVVEGKGTEGQTDADKNEPKVPGDKVKVDDPTKLTKDEKSKVVKAVEGANKDENGKSTLPEGSKVTVGDNGDVTVTYPDGSKDTIPGDKVVEGKGTEGQTDADKNEPKVPGDKVKVDDPTKLTKDEKSDVEQAIKDANKDESGKSTLPEGSKVTVGDNGDVTVTYPDGSKDTIPGDKVVEGKGTEGQTDADKNEPKVPGDKVKVDDPTKLTKDEKSDVEQAIKDANKDESGKSTLPEGSKVTVGDNGDVTVTYPDGSKDTIPGDKVVEGKGTEGQTDADKNEPKVPGDKVKVDDPTKLTKDEKSKVVKAVEGANKDENGKSTLPEGSKVTVGDNGDVTVTYPDGSKDTIPGDKVVEGKGTEGQTDADKNEPKVPGDKVKVDDPTKLTKDEKSDVEQAIKDANKDESGKSTLPEGSKVTVGDNGDVTVTYPDGSKDTIPGDKVVEGKGTEGQTDADKNEPKVPGDKVKVDDPTKLTKDEKSDVEQAIKDANKDESGKSTLPEGSKVTVGDNGDVTVTYPDGSKDTIPGDKVVEGKGTEGQTDADKNEPKVPGDKVKVDDPTKLTKDEKSKVVKAVEGANKDENGKSTLPEGSKVTVGDNGDVTVTYPDGSKDTIPGDKVVEGKGTEGQTDADKNEPKVPGDKVKVDDPTKLTDNEKNAVKDKVDEANPNLPDGTKVTVGDDGTTTITYPDGSTNTISGHDLVTGKTDADKYPLNPGQAVDVVDPNHLTQAEQDQVKEAIRTTNPTAPIATITVDTAGNVQVTFADGSTTTLQANLHKHVTEATTSSAMKPGVGTNGGQTKGATSTNQTATKQQAQQHLPQTGDQPATWAMLIGLGVAFLGLLGLKKKRED